MKKLLLIILLTFCIQTLSVSQSCLPGGITFSTQEQIDSFQTDYPGCTEIEGDVWINYQGQGPEIASLNGLSVVTSISGALYIAGNDSLYSLEGLENLQTIGGVLGIGNYYSWCVGNPNLSDISALSNLTSIGGGLVVCGSLLSSLEGLENIDPTSIIGSIFILENPMLSHCEVHSICDYLAIPGSSLSIFENATGCNSQEEVEEGCETVSIEENNLACLNIHPNPITTSTTIEYELSIPGDIQIRIFNHLGQIVESIDKGNIRQGNHQYIWNASGLPNGIYFVQVRVGQEVVTKKVIKVR